MTSFDRRRFLEIASATGVAAAVSPGAAIARGLDERKPNLLGVHADNGARVIAQHVLGVARDRREPVDELPRDARSLRHVLLPLGRVRQL